LVLSGWSFTRVGPTRAVAPELSKSPTQGGCGLRTVGRCRAGKQSVQNRSNFKAEKRACVVKTLCLPRARAGVAWSRSGPAKYK